jgi:Domain of unknown function (DUF4340)
MMANRKMLLGVTAAALLVAGVFVSMHRSGGRTDGEGKAVFSELQSALADVSEIRMTRGDGGRTTLVKNGNSWSVSERNYPADPVRVRELALGLSSLRVVERKTSLPANYPKLGVEPTDSPTATGTLVELVAGKQTWSLIVGKVADNRAVYVREPKDATALLAAPFINPDPDQKRWIDRLITDLPAKDVHEISAQVGKGPAYLLTRAKPGDAELTLTPVTRGGSAASNMVLSSQAEALTALNFDDLRTAPATAPAAIDKVIYRTFDGQVIEFQGHREGEKSYVSVKAHRDAALAAQFTPPPASPAAAPDAEQPAVEKPKDFVERLAARAPGVEYEVPAYKYAAIFKPYEELLEKKSP